MNLMRCAAIQLEAVPADVDANLAATLRANLQRYQHQAQQALSAGQN